MIDTQDLIERWQAGEEKAAQLLYEQHQARMYRLAYGLMGNAQDAEEVAQDALAYALINIDKYRADKAKFSTWLHTITVSRVRDHQRRKRFTLVSLTNWLQSGADVADYQPSAEQIVDSGIQSKLIWQALDTLTPQLREALVLRYWSGQSFKEMAAILNCPLGTAQSRVRRAFEQLRKQLTPEQLAILGKEMT